MTEPLSEHSRTNALLGEHFMASKASRRRGQWFLYFAALVLLVLVTVNVVTLVINAHKPPPFAPLGDYPLQTVGLPLEGTDAGKSPTLHFRTGDETVPVHAVKCNNNAEDVTVTGESQWRLNDIPGTFVPGSKGQAVRRPGCQNFDYQNPLPEAVKQRLRQLHEAGDDSTSWQISGQDIPVAPSGEQGIIKLWHSENFTIVYEVKNG